MLPVVFMFGLKPPTERDLLVVVLIFILGELRNEARANVNQAL